MDVLLGTIMIAAIIFAMRRKELRVKITGTVLFGLLVIWLSMDNSDDYVMQLEDSLYNINMAVAERDSCTIAAETMDDRADCDAVQYVTLDGELDEVVENFNNYYD